MLKQWVLVVFAVVFLALFIVSLVPFFVNAESFRPSIESQLSAALGREVVVGNLTFSILGGTLNADDLSIADDPDYSAVPFVQAKKLNIGVEVLPIIFSHHMHITKLHIEAPSMQLIQNASGEWNFASLGSPSTQQSATQQPDSPLDFVLEELRLSDGSALVSSIPITGKPFEYTEVNLTVKNFSFQKSSPFEFSAKLPGDGTLKLNGDAGPISRKDTTQTPFQATLQLKEFDPVASGVIDKSKGILMHSDVDAQLKSDGTTVSSTGKIKASGLQLVPHGAPAQDPVDIDFSLSKNLETRMGIVSDLTVHAGSAEAHANGSFQFTPQGTTLDLHLNAPSLPIDQVEGLLPVVGIHLPSGSSLQGGALTANITISGPITAATIAGPVEVDNTKLAGFDLGSRIQGLSPISGTADGTAIQVLKAKVSSSAEGSRITEIACNLPQLGSAAGEGTVEQTGAISFNLNAKLNPSKETPVSRAIPLTVTGTAVNPLIKANGGGALR